MLASAQKVALTIGTGGTSAPSLSTFESILPTSSSLKIFWASETAGAGDDISVQGYFPATATIHFAYPDSSKHVTLQIVSQGTNIILARLPESLPVGVYQIWVESAGGRSSTYYINRVRATAFNSPVIYAGGPLSIKGQNLLIGNATPTIRFVNQSSGTISFGKFIRQGSDAYNLNLTAPLSLVAGINYKVFINNGYDPYLTGVQVADEATGSAYTIAGIAAQPDTYGLTIGWSAEFAPVTPTQSVTLSGYNNNEAGFTNALQSTANSLSGRGEVWLPDGTYTQDGTGFLGYQAANGVVIRAIHETKVTINFNASYAKVIGITPGTSGVGFIGINFNNTDLTTTNAGLLLCYGSSVFFKNCGFTMQKARRLEFANQGTAGKILIDNCWFDSYGSRDFNGLFAINGMPYVTVRNNEGTIIMGPEISDCSKVWYTGNTLTRDWNRPKEDPMLAIHLLVTPFMKSGYLAGNKFYLVGNVLRDGNGVPIMNDGESIISEQADRVDFFKGTTTSAGASTLTDAAANFGTFVRKPTVAIIAGKGMGQTRLIASNTSTTLTLNTPWDVVPDASSIYVTYNWGMENTAIVANRFENQQRGITLYHNPMRRVDVAGNELLNSGSVDLTQIQVNDGGRLTFAPLYNINLTNNYVNAQTDAYQGGGVGVQVVQHAIAKTWGTTSINLRMSGNTIINAATAKPMIQDEAYAPSLNAYLRYHTVGENYSDEGIPVFLGTIISSNTVQGGLSAVTLGIGSYHTSIRKTTRLGNAVVDDQIQFGTSKASTNTVITTY